MIGVKELRYNVMLALYFPILLYAFSTFDLDDDTYAVKGIEPIVVGEETVILGQPFSARAFLAVSGGQGQNLEGGELLHAIGDSMFTMDTGELLSPEESEREVDYNGVFRFQQIGGAEVELPVNGRFKVRRPEIVAQSEALQTLYRRTANTVRIEVPGLEDKPITLQVGSSKKTGRTLAVSPAGKEVVVDVRLEDGDIWLGSKKFQVIDPPRPELAVLNATGRKINNGDNIPRGRAMLEFKVEPDQEFLRRYPKDARYRVTKATVFLRKGLTASKEVGKFDMKGGKLVLTKSLRSAKSGDRVLIRLDGVVRINHQGAAIPVPLSESSRTFGFVVS